MKAVSTLSLKIKIAVVDDHNLFRKGLIKLINLGDKENKYSIVFEAENGTDLKEKLTKKNMPDIILMDINMPETDGYEAADWLRKYFPDINVLVISMIDSEEAILRMIALGVKGFLSKDIEEEDMHHALDALANNGYYFSDQAKSIMSSNNQGSIADGGILAGKSTHLSEKEREFLKLACTELTYVDIAKRMNLSVKTIDGYREALFIRLNVKTKVGLVLFAVKNGIVKL
jgi:two-component system invasion response regulator UvrY